VEQNRPIEQQCPYDEASCPIRNELDRLRKRVQELEALSRTDSLTGLYNVGYFLSTLEDEMERVRRTGTALSLVMIDLDHFKRINDTYGHEAGNEALKWTSRVWHKLLRRIDILCRYGGEEFSVILPGTRLHQGVVAAERLRQGLEESPVSLEGDRVVLTASFGVEAFAGTEKLSARGLIKRADRFLLKAKEDGRNCVRCDEERFTRSSTEVTSAERQALVREVPGEE
jgi:diguanylate cyclase (GGDEF)-like protein